MALRIRRGLEADLPQGELGEPLYCTDNHKLYIGQGKDIPARDLCENLNGLDEKYNALTQELTITNQDIQDIINMINGLG